MHSPNLATPRAPTWRTRWASIVAIAAVLVTLTGCGGGDGSGDSATAADSGANADELDAGKASEAERADSVTSGSSAKGGDVNATAYDKRSPADLFGPALIKTAAITLEANSIGPVITGINSLVARVGGQISSEDTATSEAGVQVRSHIELRVPVDEFDRAVQDIVGLGDLVAKTRTSEDVTARLVDVDSRVDSAEDSIAALRTLFNRATKLGDVIALERELSDREANLEALQAQQRSLRAQTSMSTIIVDVSAEPAAREREASSGFLAGIEQGWDGLVRFVVGFSHAVGLLLPLGSLALLTALIAWVLARRFLPRRVARTSE